MLLYFYLRCKLKYMSAYNPLSQVILFSKMFVGNLYIKKRISIHHTCRLP